MTRRPEPYQILDLLGSWKDDMLDEVQTLVEMETPTEDTKAQHRIIHYLQQKFETEGFKGIHIPGKKTGGVLYLRPVDRKNGIPPQLLIGHCDTVWPSGTLDKRPVVRDKSKLTGPGVYDMKAGLTQMLFAVRACRKLELPLPYPPIILINSDEEKGSRESSKYIRCLAKIAKRAFVLEPPLGLEGKLKTARKGIGRFTVSLKGQPAHAGLDPGKGASAIVELSHTIQKLFNLNDPARGISVNVGMIEGGISPNVVAPVSKAIVDVRALHMKDANRLEKMIKSIDVEDENVTIEIEGGFGRPPMEKTARNRALWQLARNRGKELGLDLEEGTAGGGSDGNTTSKYTATLDGLGTPGDGAHAEHEFIYSDKIIERTALLTLLLTSA